MLSFLNNNDSINKNQYKLLLQKIKQNPNQIGIKKNFYFNRYNTYKRSKTNVNINISSLRLNDKNNSSLNNNSLVGLTKFLLEKYKLTDQGKYSLINSKIKENIKNEQINEENEDNINNNEDKYVENINDEKEEKVIIINLFGLNIKVKNIKNA